MALEFGAFRDEITKYDTFRYMGKIEKIVGMTIEASGPACNIGDVCRIYSKDMTSFIRAEVVGFNSLFNLCLRCRLWNAKDFIIISFFCHNSFSLYPHIGFPENRKPRRA